MSDRPVRVAMLGPYPADPARLWGGVQAAYLYLVRGLQQVPGVELHVLTLRAAGQPGPDARQDGALRVHYLPMYPRLERARNYRNFQAAVNRKLEEIQPDVVHVQDVAADAYVALRSGYPTVMTVHGIRREDRKHIRSWTQRLRNYFDTAFIEQYTLRRTRHLIAINRYVTETYQSLLPVDGAVYYIPNAVDAQFFSLPGGEHEHTVLYAGRVTPLKRVMDLVQAFALVVARVPTAQLRIAGEMTSDRDYAAAVRAWVRQANLEQNIHLLGPLPEQAIQHEYAACRLLALASAQESAPMVIAQAMAAGKPVVATRVGGVPEMLGEDCSRGLLVRPGSISEMADAIVRLLQDPRLRAAMGESGRAFARENYHPLSVARRTAEVYRCIQQKEH
jgi:glycosyltransferase involved in cell wall biosynthesis